MSVKKTLFLISGFISLGFGILGIFLPVLPTTPFLLLAAALFARSSDRWYQKLITHPQLGSYIRNFREYKAIPLKVKIYSISLMWIAILCSAFFAVHNWWIRGVLFAIAIGVSIHIASFKTLKKTEN